MDFEDQLTVIRIRKRDAAPFLKYKYIYLKKADVKSKKSFSDKINNICKSWPDSEYQLKTSEGKVFVKFRIKDGKVAGVLKKSDITGNDYPVAKYMKH